jgi:TM2 domain-containing membrane protein YozV
MHKSRGITILLAVFLGIFGAHRFYLGQIFWGFLFLLTFWTLVPIFFVLIDIIRYAFMSDKKFNKRYNSFD